MNEYVTEEKGLLVLCSQILNTTVLITLTIRSRTMYMSSRQFTWFIWRM